MKCDFVHVVSKAHKEYKSRNLEAISYFRFIIAPGWNLLIVQSKVQAPQTLLEWTSYSWVVGAGNHAY